MGKLALHILVFANVLWATTPCARHAGTPYPWEGSGICTGNLQLEIPLKTLGFALNYNSVTPSGDYGFGSAAWRLSIDDRIKFNANEKYIELGDGTPLPFTGDNSNWTSQHLAITRSNVTFSGGQAIWETHDKSVAVFTNPINDGTNTIYAVTEVRNRAGNTTKISRDANQNITQIENPFGNKIVFTYSSERIAEIKDYSGGKYSFLYDPKGRLIRVVYPDGGFWQVSYYSDKPQHEPLVSELIDPLQNISQFIYASTTSNPFSLRYVKCDQEGALGVVCKVFVKRSQYLYEYEYDQDLSGYSYVMLKNQIGNLKESYNASGGLIRTIQNGYVTKYTLNGALLPTAVQVNANPVTDAATLDSAGLIAEKYTYDNRLNITSYTNSDKVKTTYTYDGNDNVTQISSPVETVSLSYHNNLPVTIATSSGTNVAIARNASGLPTQVTENGRVIYSATYNNQGLTTSETRASGLTSSYAYSQGYLTSVTDGLGQQTTMAVNALGQPTSIQKPGGIAVTRQYDAMGNLTYDSVTGPSGETVTYTADYPEGYTALNNKYRPKKFLEDAPENVIRFAKNFLIGEDAIAEGVPSTVVQQNCSTGTSSTKNLDPTNGDTNENGVRSSGACTVAEVPEGGCGCTKFYHGVGNTNAVPVICLSCPGKESRTLWSSSLPSENCPFVPSESDNCTDS